MWSTPSHRVKKKEEGQELNRKGQKSWCHGLSPVNIVQYAFPTYAPSPCVPTPAITKPFSLQGARACWSLGCEGVQRGCVHSRYDRGGVQGEWERDADKTWCVSGVWLLGNGSRTIISSWGCDWERGNELNVKHCGLLTQTMKTCEQ